VVLWADGMISVPILLLQFDSPYLLASNDGWNLQWHLRLERLEGILETLPVR
jgi:hypothetical protein